MKEVPLCPCRPQQEGGLWRDCKSFELLTKTYTCGEGMEREEPLVRCQLEAKLNKH